MSKILGIIPARYGSQRLAGKVLADIGGKSMVQRVYEQAKQCERLARVIVATDDERIQAHVAQFGGECQLTRADHQTGTDRCAEVVASFGEQYQAAINIQGDEPFINPRQIDEVAALLENPETQIATLVKRVESYEELIDEKEAKVVLNQHQEAIYMSRSPIPYLRGVPMPDWHKTQDYYKHIGIYGFRADVLARISSLPQSFAEKSEGLEQLRWMAFFKIKVGVTQYETLAIDTAEDLQKAQEYLKKTQ